MNLSHSNHKPKSYNRNTKKKKTKKKKPKYNTTGNHQTTKEGTKRRRKNYKTNQETSNKMALSSYLSIITLNVNGQKALIRKHSDWMDKITKTHL